VRPQIVKRGLAGIRRKDRWARLERASVGFCISVMHRCLHPGSNMSHLAMSACLPSSIIDLWLITCLLMTLENRFMMDIESASTCQLGGLHGRGRLAVIGPIGHGRHGAGASHWATAAQCCAAPQRIPAARYPPLSSSTRQDSQSAM
jgi:hypothetical protein